MIIQSASAATTQTASDRPDRPADALSRTPPPDETALRKAVDAANGAMRSNSSTSEFTVAQDVGKTIVRVIDQSTNEVIRQIPSEEMIAIAREIDRMQGILLKARV